MAMAEWKIWKSSSVLSNNDWIRLSYINELRRFVTTFGKALKMKHVSLWSTHNQNQYFYFSFFRCASLSCSVRPSFQISKWSEISSASLNGFAVLHNFAPSPIKTDEFSEKFQTTFDSPRPHPHTPQFWGRVDVCSFKYILDRKECLHYKVFVWIWPPPLGTFPKIH